MAREKLYLRLHRFYCRDETGTAPIGEWGSDEMWLTGLTFSALGIGMLSRWRMGSFNDGDDLRFEALPYLARFDLDRFGDFDDIDAKSLFPATFIVILIPWEADAGGTSSDVIRYRTQVTEAIQRNLEAALKNELPRAKNEALHEAARDWTKKGIEYGLAKLGATAAIGTKVLDALGIDAKGALAQSFSEILGGVTFQDDIFRAKAVAVTLDAPVHKWPDKTGRARNNSLQEVVTWTDHNSKYELTYDWVSTRSELPAFRKR